MQAVATPPPFVPTTTPTSERRKLWRRWRDQLADFEVSMARMRDDLAQNDHDVELARELLRNAEEFRLLTANAIQSLTFQLDNARNLYEQEMAELVDPEIESFLTWLEAEKDKLPRQIRFSSGLTRINPSTGRQVPVTESNIEEVQDAIRAVTRIGFTVQGYRLHPPDDVTATLAAHRREVEDAVASL